MLILHQSADDLPNTDFAADRQNIQTVVCNSMCTRMAKSALHYEGVVPIKRISLNLDLTLLGGQSFRWEKREQTPEWKGVAYDAFWVLTQKEDAVAYKVFPAVVNNDAPVPRAACDANYFQNLLERYFHMEFDLASNVEHWRAAHEHFAQIAPKMKAVRLLDQEPLENILSFICSQNNHIKRISTMIQWLCAKYGTKIGNFYGRDEFTFPTLEALAQQQKVLESSMREAKFGYRAKFISQTVAKITSYGGKDWFYKLRQLPYSEARLELVTLPGVGYKVADCICLMSLNHLESVPIDTHIFKIAQSAYLPHLANAKTVTPKIYDEISTHFRSVYGPFSGWTQAVLFCSGLQQFKTQSEVETTKSVLKKKRK